MKKIGNTVKGEVLVEMTKDEYFQFLMAEISVREKCQNFNFGFDCNPETEIRTNFQQFFAAMRLFVRMKFKVNELKAAVGDTEKILNIRKPKEIPELKE